MCHSVPNSNETLTSLALKIAVYVSWNKFFFQSGQVTTLSTLESHSSLNLNFSRVKFSPTFWSPTSEYISPSIETIAAKEGKN